MNWSKIINKALEIMLFAICLSLTFSFREVTMKWLIVYILLTAFLIYIQISIVIVFSGYVYLGDKLSKINQTQ